MNKDYCMNKIKISFLCFSLFIFGLTNALAKSNSTKGSYASVHANIIFGNKADFSDSDGDFGHYSLDAGFKIGGSYGYIIPKSNFRSELHIKVYASFVPETER